MACSSDLQEVLQQDPNVQEAEKELEEVTVLLRQSLANVSPAKPRTTVPITEVDTLVFLYSLHRGRCSFCLFLSSVTEKLAVQVSENLVKS